MVRLERRHRHLALQGANSTLEYLVLVLLFPFSVLYGVIGWLRGRAYDLHLLRSCRAEVPVISVGNLSAGGTGKTPTVDLLVKLLIDNGKRPAVISRGYGGRFQDEVGLVSDGENLLLSVEEAGDEPVLLARRNPSCLVLIARKRLDALPLAIEKLGADVLILDDGFQHRSLRRDLDLLLLDGRWPFGNGLPLPGGLLREFPSAIRRADMVLLTRAGQGSRLPDWDKPLWTSRHTLSSIGYDQRGTEVPLLQLNGQRLGAFAGLADPQGFFFSLQEAGLDLTQTLPLSDHVNYDASMLTELGEWAAGLDALLTTEKDGVKLAGAEFPCPCIQVPMALDIDQEENFKAAVFQALRRE